MAAAAIEIATAIATATAEPGRVAMPQAILLQDVESLGERGTVVDVSAGYLRNYLLPRKLAESATASSIKAARKRQEDAERAVREAEERSRESAAVLGPDGADDPAAGGRRWPAVRVSDDAGHRGRDP